jgi:hypothetical protein
MFTLKIKTEGAAFCDPFTGEKDRHSAQEEVLRILKDLVLDLELQAHGGAVLDFKKLRDANGNHVGEAKFTK